MLQLPFELFKCTTSISIVVCCHNLLLRRVSVDSLYKTSMINRSCFLKVIEVSMAYWWVSTASTKFRPKNLYESIILFILQIGYFMNLSLGPTFSSLYVTIYFFYLLFHTCFCDIEMLNWKFWIFLFAVLFFSPSLRLFSIYL